MSKNITTSQDTIVLENVAISPVNFEVKDTDGNIIPSTQYYFNPQKGQLYFYNKTPQQLKVSYFNYPSFLTQTYSPFDKNLIIPKATPSASTFSLGKSFNKNDFFGDLNTYGNITRGITVGNNQGSVLNSGLDLQITGNLSENLKIRASIKDSNLPIQENGISQSINEFDRVFIELFTDTWNIKAGDVDLTNQDSYFMAFTKKINGAKIDVTLDDGEQKTFITASGALVKGKFTTQNISAVEGNQGPYKLYGANGEQNIVVISGSEVIYVNGITLKRGEQHDYTIDYNTAEITFTPTFPINSSQRIIIDFQYSDRNYNRFVTHDGVTYQNEKFTIGTYFYNENDVKNQPLQQNLSDEQKLVLQQAGNDPSQMIANSAVSTEYDENRVQYEKTSTNGQDIFVFSNDENATLYNVQFSYVGTNNGDYSISQTTATGTIYEYVGTNLGDYSPVILLIAPTKLQMAVVKAAYQINNKSFINSEIAYSNNDRNLFSSKDDHQNHGLATTLTWQQQISDGDWNTNNLFDLDFVQKNFNNVEGLYNAEFNRDWNIDVNLTPNFLGNQTYIRNALVTKKSNQHKITLNTDYLKLGDIFTGYKTGLNSYNTFGKAILNTQNSYLKSSNNNEQGYFIRNLSTLKYQLKKAWVTGLFNFEDNQQKNTQTNTLNLNNQKLIKTGLVLGVGDSTKVYSKFGFDITQIDSVRTNQSVKVQNAKNYSIESQLIKTEQTSLKTFINYRKVKHFYTDDIDVFNGRAQYTQQFFKNILRWATVYETTSGSTPQQNFTYIEVEPGQGYYTYLGDLNNNGIKDFDEFEVAQFADQANYLRVVLPNINRVATQKAKLSQSVFINFIQFKNNDSKWLKVLSHFSNQSSILINKDQLKDGKKFNINPFDIKNDDVIGLQQNMRTSLFFNRGLQNYSTTYTFQNNKNTQNISSDFQTATQNMHELNFQHNILSSWIIATTANTETNNNTSTGFNSRNFNILSKKINPSISYLKDEFSTLKTNYTFRNEHNNIGLESLKSHDFGLEYNYNNPKKGSVIANVNMIENKYNGPVNTPASYRILEGLQPNRNYTWSLIIQKKLTQLLDLSVSYSGRKNTASNAIHTGSVQLRANF
ncbi:hypothetical protein AXE80_13845 [Wenyingzhuangia fucanilytica]|uniref:Uncharacterized protein n=1 Tax=Wenyingzhuangia fucanilytica TaxID=1790137 RepID=A0A1B1Y999_9FLAO|nr:hypothetical protein [Wenyingzhuangia fucanilytica]ANW97308.1 hypothetical protein AXE80_13845 [Wenyingzhuangia fucanilytica]